MEVLQSRILLRPRDPERTRRFYGETLELPVYREFSGGVVYFLGGGFLEISGRADVAATDATATDATQLWIQVRDVDATHARLEQQGVPIDEPPVDKPWSLRELRARDPDGRRLIFVQVPADHPLRRDRR